MSPTISAGGAWMGSCALTGHEIDNFAGVGAALLLALVFVFAILLLGGDDAGSVLATERLVVDGSSQLGLDPDGSSSTVPQV